MWEQALGCRLYGQHTRRDEPGAEARDEGHLKVVWC